MAKSEKTAVWKLVCTHLYRGRRVQIFYSRYKERSGIFGGRIQSEAERKA